MRIAIFTQDDPFYLPALIERIVQARGADVRRIVILKPFNESLKRTASRVLALYGPVDFVFQGLRFVKHRAAGWLARAMPASCSRPWSVENVARKYGVPVDRPGNVNDPAYLAYLKRDVQPDVVLSVAASQIFRKPLLALPPLGCINVHTAPLPRYRGMLPNFWVLLNGESETAVTVHEMNEKLDDGPILMQQAVPIHPDDTLESLIRRTKQVAAEVVLKVLDQLEAGTAQRLPNDSAAATYFSFPTRADAMLFRQRGLRVR